jgi:hypothetical protein
VLFPPASAPTAHQIEGIAGGGQYADWYPFEHTPGNIYDKANADVATDQWDRYQQNFQLAASIAVKTVRTSVAWEKVEPAEGAIQRECDSALSGRVHLHAELRDPTHDHAPAWNRTAMVPEPADGRHQIRHVVCSSIESCSRPRQRPSPTFPAPRK